MLFIGAIAGNLIFTGHFIYGVPLTIAGFLIAFFFLKAEQKEKEMTKKLLSDKSLY